MGLYDRGYVRDPYRDDEGSMLRVQFGRPMVTLIIIVTAAFHLVDFLTNNTIIYRYLALQPDAWRNPLLWYQYATYGLVHAPNSVWHVVFNMLGLFFLGPPVEQRLGRFEFLRFYVLAIVLGGIVSNVVGLLLPGANAAIVLGASGGVQAVVMLFVLQNPQQTIYLNFLIPVKAWVLGVIMLATNLLSGRGSGTAVEVHLAGIALAAAYHFGGWNLGLISWDNWTEWVRERQSARRRERTRASLRVHRPAEPPSDEAQEADRILDKIHHQGEASLTAEERETLERYSRRMRERRGQS